MDEKFPKQIPVFPLSGVIYFPKTNLPLNIFEERYLELVNDSFRNNKLMGMVQSKKENRPITLTETTAQSSFRTGRRDFIYVKDVADAYVATLKSENAKNGEVVDKVVGNQPKSKLVEILESHM